MPRNKSSDWIPYSERLKKPKWQKKRLEIMQRDEFTCQECGRDDLTLNVHHKFYFSIYNPWDYEPKMLVTLCEGCHKEREKAITAIKMAMLEFCTDDFWLWTATITQAKKKFAVVKERIESAAKAQKPIEAVPKTDSKNYFQMMREAIG